MTAADSMRTDNVNDEIPEATEVSVFDDEVAVQSPWTGLPLLHSTDGMFWRPVVKPESLQICSSAVRMVSFAYLPKPMAALCFQRY